MLLELEEELEELVELKILLEDDTLLTLELLLEDDELTATELLLDEGVFGDSIPQGSGCWPQVVRAIQLRLLSQPQPSWVVTHNG